MTAIAPVTVGIPTWGRGARVFATIDRVMACIPRPAELIVHVDASDSRLEQQIASRHPDVRVLSSKQRVGPGGGRHRCIKAATQPIFASFDDDSWPMDGDYFAEVLRLFNIHPNIALLAALIVHPWEEAPARTDVTESTVEFTGCGWAVRRDAYFQCKGMVERPLAYGIEEADLGLQFFERFLGVMRAHNLRVYHDTQLVHHRRSEHTAAAIQNVVLLAWLRYPAALWPRAFLQLANIIADQVRRGRLTGVPAGLLGIFPLLWQWRRSRTPIPSQLVRGYLARRKLPVSSSKILREPASAAN